MTTLTVTATADVLADDIRRTGGGTRSAVAGVPAPTTGYMVSLKGNERVFPRYSRLTEAELEMITRLYVETHRAWLAIPGNYVGGWVDTDTDELYLDVSVNISDVQYALATAAYNGQLAIWDVAGVREIRLDRVEPYAA